MVQIKYFKSKGVFNIMPFKILNDMVYYTLLDPRNKILTVKWAVSIWVKRCQLNLCLHVGYDLLVDRIKVCFMQVLFKDNDTNIKY